MVEFKERIKSLIANAVVATSSGIAANVAEKWAKISPGEHQLIYEQTHLHRLFSTMKFDCVFDVGANQGQYATMLRRKVGYQGLIVSFEPIPEHADYLRRQAAYDPLWEIHEVALSSTAGTAPFSIMAADQFSSLATASHEETNKFHKLNSPVKTITVNLETIDTAFKDAKEKHNFSRPYLKMDTQGFDLEVIRGGGAAMKEILGFQSELSVVRLYENAPHMAEAISIYEELGFGLSALVPNNKGHFPQLVEIDGIFLRHDLLSNT